MYYYLVRLRVRVRVRVKVRVRVRVRVKVSIRTNGRGMYVSPLFPGYKIPEAHKVLGDYRIYKWP